MLNPIETIFGVDSVAFFDPITHLFLGRLRALQSSSLKITGKEIELSGGSSYFPWDSQPGKMTAQLAIKASEYPDFIFPLFAGGTAVENAADALGFVSTPVNRQGTSVIKATTGIATVLAKAGSEGDLKTGKYVLKAVSPTTVQLYVAYDTDLGRGTRVIMVDDTQALLTVPATITLGAGTDLAGLGLTLTGGSGAIAMVVGDTATFDVRPKNTSNMEVILGSQRASFPEWGAIIMGKRMSNGKLVEVEVYRGKGQGLPINFDVDKFSEWDVNCSILQDPNQDGIARVRRITPTTPS
jgi:hypothetical protein